MRSPSSSLFFRAGMWFRIFYGFVRLGVGVSLLRVVGTPLGDIFGRFMGHAHEPALLDFPFLLLRFFLAHTHFVVTYFLAGYIIFWGIVDIILSISLLRKRLWAFPVSIASIGVFTLYEGYRFTHTHSFVLALFIAVDIALLLLIAREYRRLKIPTEP